MSNRALRRAAERQAKKAAAKQNKLNPQPVATASPLLSAVPVCPSQADVPEEDDGEDLTLSPELLAIVERIDPGYSETIARNAVEMARIQALPNPPNAGQRKTMDAEPTLPSTSRTTPTGAQINANRANSQHSTGPVTAEGKATVS